MNQSMVEDVLDMIDSLTPSERELLDQKLAERLEADWRLEADAARRQARARGIDQTAIDDILQQAVRQYGEER